MHKKIWLFAPALILCFLIESSYAVRDGEWKVIAKGTTFKPTRIFFFDADHGWLMQTGSNTSMLKRKCGRNKWCELRTFKHRYNELFFKTKFLGWMVGNGGLIIKTTDGGRVWHTKKSHSKKDLLDIIFVKNHGWAVGQDSTILYSSDGGENWVQQRTPLKANYTLMGVSFLDHKIGWVVGFRIRKHKKRAVILFTKNGGQRWISQTDNIVDGNRNFVPKDIVVTDSGWTYIAGSHGDVLMTTDEGKTWQTKDLRLGSSLNCIDFPHARIGWAVGDVGRINITKDAGFNWQPQTSPLPPQASFFDIVDIYMLSPEEGYALTAFGDMLKYSVE
jgi:photosystem II stability/assembly factor-like uncharacterized protein